MIDDGDKLKEKRQKGELKIQNLGHLFAASFYFIFYILLYFLHFMLIVSSIHRCSVLDAHFLAFLFFF